MKKKGAVYRVTMVAGFAMIMMQVVGETNYSRFWKNIRNKEIEQEKALEKKIDDMEGETQDPEEEKALNPREKYKIERLNRIKEMREKESK